MTKPISDEEIQLRKRARRRLVGAITLVILAAILLPMVLDREPKPVRQDISIKIPEPDSDGFASTVVPVTDFAANTVTGAAGNVNANTTLTPNQPSAALAAKKNIKLAPRHESSQSRPAAKMIASASENRAVAKSKLAASAEKSVFVVQLGAFSSVGNAKKLKQKLVVHGIEAYLEKLKTPQGTRTRVRAGPFITRDAAEKARDRMKKIGLTGVVAEKK